MTNKTSWMLQACEYLFTLKDKGLGDETFYNEYLFVCYERSKFIPIQTTAQTDNLQTALLLHREDLK